MSSDEIAERELINLSRDQRAFFAEMMPGKRLYPWQEEVLDALSSGKRVVFHSGRRHGKTIMLEAIRKALNE